MSLLQNIFNINGYKKTIYIDLNRQSFCQEKNLISQYNNIISENAFLKKEIEFTNPSFITNCIIDLSKGNGLNKLDNLKIFFKFLERLLCKHIVINCVDIIDLMFLKQLVSLINTNNIHKVSILIKYTDELYSDSFGNIITNSNRINSVIVFESPFNKNFENLMYFTENEMKFTTRKKDKEFTINSILYSESQNHNAYLNRKLYISPTGEIKNAPETEESFGYIQDIKSEVELMQIISTPAFQKYWFVHKGLIDVCKECEFRHMCVDNRIPIERSKDEWFQTLECNYNPYIAKWEGDEGYLTLEECGVISNDKGFSIDHEKIAIINAGLEEVEEIK